MADVRTQRRDTPRVTAGGQTGSSLVTTGWPRAALCLYRGDIFTIANVFMANPQTRASTGRLRQFVVTADTVSDGCGTATIPIYPAITPPDGAENPILLQTVQAAPAMGAALTIMA